jgi:hypothetical protein
MFAEPPGYTKCFIGILHIFFMFMKGKYNQKYTLNLQWKKMIILQLLPIFQHKIG